MSRGRLLRVVSVALLTCLACRLQGADPQARPMTQAQNFAHGRFEALSIRRPAGTPTGTVLLLGDPQRADAALAEALAARGALVVGVDTAAVLAVLDADTDDCIYAAGDFDNLARWVEAWAHLPDYHPPLLVGRGMGARLALALAAQAPPQAFDGATLIDAPSLPGVPADTQHPYCAGRPGTRQATPVIGILDALEPSQAQARDPQSIRASRFGATPIVLNAYARTAAHAAPARAAAAQAWSDLPLVELAPAAPAPAAHADLFAVLWSGDGGWAGIDRAIGDALAEAGIPVIGVDSLRYFWTPRSPQAVADDLGRILAHYEQSLGRPRALVIGYSQGADVLPFALNRLPPALAASVARIAAISLSPTAAFEFHVGNWLGDAGDTLTAPEVAKLAGRGLMCIYGDGDSDTLCPQLDPRAYQVVRLPGGHHLGGDYARLARVILGGIPDAAGS